MPCSKVKVGHPACESDSGEEAIGQIAQLYAVEKEARGSPPDRRVELRRTRAAPVFDDLEVWLAMQLTTISDKPPLAGTIRYALIRRPQADQPRQRQAQRLVLHAAPEAGATLSR